MMKRRLVVVILALCAFMGTAAADDLAERFANPPASSGPWTYWYWMSGPSNQEAITLELEAMHQQGIEGCILFGWPEYMKPEWVELFGHVLREANRLGLKISLNHDTFWTATAPWITPEMGTKKVVFAELNHQGPGKIAAVLPMPPVESGYYRNVAVIAYPVDDATTAPAVTKAPYKTASAMDPSYAAGKLDVFYQETPDTAGERPVRLDAVVDLTSRLSPDGYLDWDAPAGRWVIQRVGYTLFRSGMQHLDFFSRAALDQHLAASIEKLVKVAGPLVGKTWTHVHEDSYESGAQTWTAAFEEQFQKRRNYKITPWLPALAGHVVGNRALTDRFLHDYRRTISDLYVENHYGYFSERLRALGLKFSTEGGYGWASPIADGLRIEHFAEIPMGEFWHTHTHPITGAPLEHQFRIHGLDLGDPNSRRAIPYGFGLNSIRLAASAAHVYGHPYCQAEAFTNYTAGGYDLANSPFSLKATADRAFSDGLGRVVFHVYTNQPDARAKPGTVWEGVGMHFNRNITWWSQAHVFTTYLSRCQFLLRQGKFVADFAYWSGDTVPYESPDRRYMRPALPRGCNADLINTDALLSRVTVKDGLLTLPDGVNYRYLVLPPTRRTVNPESLRAIKKLIEEGAVAALGPRPASTAGLENYPQCDKEVEALAEEIWGPAKPGESQEAGERKLGRGRVVWGRSLEELLKTDGLPQDMEIQASSSDSDLDWIHRRMDNAEIYFVSNQLERNETAEIHFRVTGKKPELWDPVWGTRRELPVYRIEKDRTVLPVQFAPKQSWFIVFRGERKEEPKTEAKSNFPQARTVMEIAAPWEVSFDPKWGGPEKIVFEKLEDWTKRTEPGVRYYSGTATYRKTFDLPQAPAAANHLFLDLGAVKHLAEVRLNGKSLGVVWTAPWRIEITNAVKAKGNELEIAVVNLWPNRLIGDAALPKEKQLTETNIKFDRDSPLMESGLLGPVTIQQPEWQEP